MFNFLKSVGGKDGLSGSEGNSNEEDAFSQVRDAGFLDDFPVPSYMREEEEESKKGEDKRNLHKIPSTFLNYRKKKASYSADKCPLFAANSNTMDSCFIRIFFFLHPKYLGRIMRASRYFYHLTHLNQEFWSPYFRNFFLVSEYYFKNVLNCSNQEARGKKTKRRIAVSKVQEMNRLNVQNHVHWKVRFVDNFINHNKKIESVFKHFTSQLKKNELKCALIGHSQTGKSSFFDTLRSSSEKRQSMTEQPARVFNFYVKLKLKHRHNQEVSQDKNEMFSINLWDISGKEEHASMTKMYTTNTNIFFVFFNSSCSKSFEFAKRIIKNIKHQEHSGQSFLGTQKKNFRVLVENKIDEKEMDKIVTLKMIDDYLKKEMCHCYIRSSSLQFSSFDCFDVFKDVLNEFAK